MKQVSIITVNYNDKEGLQRTINSVKPLKFRDFEHIIIDAASTDGSVELIKANQDRFSYWVSEKDEGIYDGMNKGIAQANGKYVLFLNSGDYLISKDALSYIFDELNQDFLYGHLTHNKAVDLRASIYNQKLDIPFFKIWLL